MLRVESEEKRAEKRDGRGRRGKREETRTEEPERLVALPQRVFELKCRIWKLSIIIVYYKEVFVPTSLAVQSQRLSYLSQLIDDFMVYYVLI